VTKPATIDAYLAALPAHQRRLLEKVRRQIKAAAPAAEEYFGYGMPGFKLNGHPLIYIGAAKNHCALYGARSDGALADKLRAFEQTQGSIHFTAEHPIPAALVKEIVRARIAANDERWGAKPQKKTARTASKKTARTASKKTAHTASKKGSASGKR
jgi:uncharacterized protein YdhG (YjbR/CyaY superfamily)